MSNSPREMTLNFAMDINKFLEPSFCQEADTMANALEMAINVGLGVDTYANVTSLGCITLTRNKVSGNTECGGCLAGIGFLGDYAGIPIIKGS